MAQQIHILPEELCNKIAAGEVVERPASVVKELVENSLDAGADDIRIEIEQGGRKLIRVHDNGHGMVREDAFLCLERHATSKIRHDADMFALQTLGFRGEALPSIASVSRFTLRTCATGETIGTEIQVDGGVVRHAGDTGFPTGTQIEVRNLFFNTPARRKFLRKEETEIGHIADIITKQALARPAVRFQLTHNGRALIDARRERGLKERVAMLLGKSLARDLLALDLTGAESLSCAGLLAPPSQTRATTGSIYTYINGRYVRDKVVQHAIMDGYRNLLMRGRYPIVVLFLEVDPGEVDVNVHPTKHEVRFRQQRQVHDFIAGAVRGRLREGARLDSVATSAPQPVSVQPSVPAADVASGSVTTPESRSLPFGSQASVKESLQDYRPVTKTTAVSPPLPCESPSTPALEPTPVAEEISDEGFFGSLRYIGQFQGTYLLAEHGQDLVLIDQHAAHERITFEGMKRQFCQGGVQSQALMFPKVIDFDFKAAGAVQALLPELERLGFELEPFGGRSYTLKSIPQLLHRGDPETLLQDVAHEVIRYSDSARVEKEFEEVLIRMACHQSVRAHQVLRDPEVKALFAALDRIDFNAHCPHGRPVVQRLSLGEVERMFRRV